MVVFHCGVWILIIKPVLFVMLTAVKLIRYVEENMQLGGKISRKKATWRKDFSTFPVADSSKYSLGGGQYLEISLTVDDLVGTLCPNE